MPSQVITIRLCDACFIRLDKETRAVVTYSIGIIQGEKRPTPHIVEACELHRKEIDDLAELIGATVVLTPLTGGPPVKPARPEGGTGQSARIDCPICGEQRSRGIMAAHIWTQHLGEPRRPPQPVTCPDCGLVNPDGAGMGQHRFKVHRYSGIDEAAAIYYHREANPPTANDLDPDEVELDEDQDAGPDDEQLFDVEPEPEPAPAPVRRSHRRKAVAAS